MIHRLYPIINIQAVVCTNTPSNHGGSPGRRIIFKLGSVVTAGLPLAAAPPRTPRDGNWSQPSPHGAERPHGEEGCSSRSPRIAFKGEGSTLLAPFPVRGRVFVWLWLLSSPRRLPAYPHLAARCPPLGWGEARRATTSPALFLLSPDLCGARPLPCRALPGGCISPLPPASGATGGPPATSSCPAGPAPAGPDLCARGSAPQQPSARGDSAGARGGQGGTHRLAASRQNGRGMQVEEVEGAVRSQFALLPQRGCRPPSLASGRGCASRARHPTAAPVGSALRLPHRALPRPGQRFSRPRAAVGRPSFPAGGWPRRACVRLSVPPGLSAPSAEQGPEDPRASPLLCGAGKRCGAKQTQQGRFVIRLCKKDSGA